MHDTLPLNSIASNRPSSLILTSMHRAHTNIAKPALVIPDQLRIQAHDMFIRDLGERLISQVYGAIEKCVVHLRIIDRALKRLHSYFPGDFFVHTESYGQRNIKTSLNFG